MASIILAIDWGGFLKWLFYALGLTPFAGPIIERCLTGPSKWGAR